MKVEDLKNTKIYLSNVEDRVKFQKKMFSLGIKWYSSDETISYLDSPFYFVDWDLRLSHGSKVDYLCFADSSDRQIFLHDVLAIEEPRVKFKPFDKVLVRDSDSEKYPYMDINSILYTKRIPYEGNEHLVVPCKNPNK